MQEPEFWDLQKIKAASNRCFPVVKRIFCRDRNLALSNCRKM